MGSKWGMLYSAWEDFYRDDRDIKRRKRHRPGRPR